MSSQGLTYLRHYWTIRLLMGALILLLGSTYLSCQELKYSLWGRTASAEIIRRTNVKEPGRGGTLRPLVRVEYRFQDERGTTGNGKLNFAADSDVPAGMALPIQYLPGEPGESRLLGQRNLTPVYIMLGFVAILAGLVVKLLIEARSVMSPHRPCRRG